MTRILLTGFPGFLAGRLLPDLLGPHGPDEVVCLVEPRMAEAARARATAITAGHPGTEGRIRLLEGDLTDPAIFAGDRDPGQVDRVVHLAAAYRLDVDRRTATAVNVEGTRHLLRLALRQGDPPHFLHVSTCYVSGRHAGLFREEDLELGQRFDNAYEETKFLAEVEVREAAERGLPVTVARPSVVTGDSRTGAAEKHDGLHYLIAWIDALRPVALVPRLPGMRDAFFNVVPCDFVTAALARMARRTDLAGRTFHLADPDPLPVSRLVREAGRALGRPTVLVPVPRTLAHLAVRAVGTLPRMPRIPGESLAYLSHPTRYGTEATLPFLEEEGIPLPDIRTLLPRLAHAYREGGGARPAPAEPAGVNPGG